VYDSDHGQLLVFGGSARFGAGGRVNQPGTGRVLDDLWAWDGVHWRRLA
jgi:hypothetical protein